MCAPTDKNADTTGTDGRRPYHCDSIRARESITNGRGRKRRFEAPERFRWREDSRTITVRVINDRFSSAARRSRLRHVLISHGFRVRDFCATVGARFRVVKSRTAPEKPRAIGRRPTKNRRPGAQTVFFLYVVYFAESLRRKSVRAPNRISNACFSRLKMKTNKSIFAQARKILNVEYVSTCAARAAVAP